MSFLTQLIQGITPAPVLTPEEYDGWEFRWKYFVFRPATLKTEGYLVLGLFIYLLFTFYGISRNGSKAKKWLAAHLPVYEQQFSKPQSKDGLTADGYSDYFNFSTGRRNIGSLHTIFTLRPRHDLFQILYQTAWGLIDLQYHPEDEVQLDFKLAPGALPHDFVWGVVAKDNLSSVKKDRWDLTFTKTTENAALPSTFSVMSEFADVTEAVLKPVGGFSIVEALKDPKVQPYFLSLSITDQPRQRPLTPLTPDAREKHVILNLRLPPSSQSASTVPLVTSLFAFVDNLNKLNLRPETKIKLKKAREETDRLITKEADEERREEEADRRAAEKKKKEEEKMAKLSPAEQKKEMEKEKKRALRKAQGKVSIRK